MKVIVCGYGQAGSRVLRKAVARPDVSEIYLFTHETVPAWVDDVRHVADSLGVPYSTENIDSSILPFEADVISSVWYRNIIRQSVIDAVSGRIFNLHPSLLPRHRGCSSVPWALIEGDSRTGTTAHYIDAGVDTGNILCAASTPIKDDDTQATLYSRCMDLAVAIWDEALDHVVAGDPGRAQVGPGCEHRRGVPEAGAIDDTWPEDKIERFIRAMIYPPLPPATYRGNLVESMSALESIRATARAN